MQRSLFTALYIGANTAANLILVATPIAWRATVSIIIAATFVALDITTRDKLHDLWGGDRRKLGALIVGGALLSAIVNIQALPVAIASCVAFAAAGAADTVAYHRLRSLDWYRRVNGSNIAAAFVDSAIFLGLAALFSVIPLVAVPVAFAGQFVAKVAGGFIWSLVLRDKSLAVAR